MRIAFCRLLLLAWLLAVPAARAMPSSDPAAPSDAHDKPVVVLAIDGAIEPAAVALVARALVDAGARKAQLLVLRLDTPGGLDRSMRAIIRQILGAPIPIATYVAPSGARAASAGTYLLYASHVAAMAQATNLGAATPVVLGGMPAEPPAPPSSVATGPAAPHAGDPMAAKRLSDASAYLRGLAQLRGRNVAWAEQAVRDSASLSAPEALERHVIDLIATDVPDLLRQLDGRSYAVSGGSVQLHTAHAPVIEIEAGWRSELLSVLANPNLALVLLVIGIFGLVFEFSNPGFLLPGVVGAISLLLGLFALQTLPLNYAGLALLVLGIGFLIAEAFVPSFGALGLGGMVAFAIGATMLVDRDVPGVAAISYALIAVLTLLSAAFVLIVVGMAVRARRRPVVSGAPALLGQTAQLVEFDAAHGAGWAMLAGVNWRVRAAAENPIRPASGWQAGALVTVRAVQGNTLLVSIVSPPPAFDAMQPSPDDRAAAWTAVSR